MKTFLIIAATSGVGESLAKRLRDTHEVFTASRSTNSQRDARHAAWYAVYEPFPEDFLPQRLDGLVYCPGSISLQPFEHLNEHTYRKDFELNLLGAIE